METVNRVMYVSNPTLTRPACKSMFAERMVLSSAIESPTILPTL